MASNSEENNQRKLERTNAELSAALRECREQLTRVERMLDQKLSHLRSK